MFPRIEVITDTVIIRNPRVKKQNRHQFVLDNLQILGLRKKAEDGVRVRSLSGGEQRRAAIANELVAEPEIFFLDEPAVTVNLFQIFVESLIVLEIAVLMEKGTSEGKLLPSGGKIPFRRRKRENEENRRKAPFAP